MKKIIEDIKPVETDDVDLPPEEIFDYMSKSFIGTDDEDHRFYIVWDIHEIEKLLGTQGERAMTEWLFDKWFGEYNWGYEDEWYICSLCGQAVNSYNGGFVMDYDNGDCICSDCIINDNYDSQRWYIDYLRNNTEECNQFLSDSTMRSLGWHDYDSYDGYWGSADGRTPNSIYDALRERFPTPGPDGVDFIFDWMGMSYKVWADKDLSDYVDEEGESDEEQ